MSVVILVLTATESRGVARSMRQAGIDVSTASLPEGSEIVRALVIDPSNPRTIYAGTYGGAIKSTDGGGSWSAVNDGLGNRAVVSLAIDPSNTNIIYGGNLSGIFKSTNGGDAWRAVNNGLSTPSVNAIAIDPSSSDTVYVGVPALCSLFGCTPGGGVFKSTDGGESWNQINSGLPSIIGISYLAVDSSNTSKIYAAADLNKGIFKSTNGGASWSGISDGLTRLFSGALAIDPSDPETLYVSDFGVYKSINGGTSWSAVNAGLDDHVVLSLAIDPSDTNTIYAGTNFRGVFKSTDGATSWNAVNNGLTSVVQNVGVNAIAVDPSNTATIYVGTFGSGVFKTTDGGISWTPTGITPKPKPEIVSVVFDPPKKLMISGSNFGGSPLVMINDQDRTGFVRTVSDSTIELNGKAKKLGLKPGDNLIQVINSVGVSNVFVLRI